MVAFITEQAEDNTSMPACDALLLFAHGARDVRWSASLQALAAALRARVGTASVHAAFLELQAPSLTQALEAAVAQGAHRIQVLPVFWAAAGHIENDLPPLLAQFRERHPGIRVSVLPVLSELPGMLDFIADAVAETLSAAPLPQGGTGDKHS